MKQNNYLCTHVIFQSEIYKYFVGLMVCFEVQSSCERKIVYDCMTE